MIHWPTPAFASQYTLKHHISPWRWRLMFMTYCYSLVFRSTNWSNYDYLDTHSFASTALTYSKDLCCWWRLNECRFDWCIFVRIWCSVRVWVDVTSDKSLQQGGQDTNTSDCLISAIIKLNDARLHVINLGHTNRQTHTSGAVLIAAQWDGWTVAQLWGSGKDNRSSPQLISCLESQIHYLILQIKANNLW